MSWNELLINFPTYSIICFFIVFVISASIYPGGSQYQKDAKGFSWIHNYWCDILDSHGYSGKVNRAMNLGVFGTLILCIGTGVLCFYLPLALDMTPLLSASLRILGVGAVVVISLIFTPLHNWVIAIASIMGLGALFCILYGLYQSQLLGLFYFGIISIVIIGINNYIFFSRKGVLHLPWIQKISLVFILAWFAMLNQLIINELT